MRVRCFRRKRRKPTANQFKEKRRPEIQGILGLDGPVTEVKDKIPIYMVIQQPSKGMTLVVIGAISAVLWTAYVLDYFLLTTFSGCL